MPPHSKAVMMLHEAVVVVFLVRLICLEISCVDLVRETGKVVQRKL